MLKDRVLSFEEYRKISDAYDRLVTGDEGIDGDIIAAVEEKLLSKQDIQLLIAIADGKVDPKTTVQRIDFTEKNPYIDGDIIAAVEEKLLSKQDIQLLIAIADGKVDPKTTVQRIDFTEKNPYLSYGLDTEMEMEL